MKIRLSGLALLCMCAVASLCLHRLVLAPPVHAPSPLECLFGLLAFVCGCLGAALTVLGRALSGTVPVPPRAWRPVSRHDDPGQSRFFTASLCGRPAIRMEALHGNPTLSPATAPAPGRAASARECSAWKTSNGSQSSSA